MKDVEGSHMTYT